MLKRVPGFFPRRNDSAVRYEVVKECSHKWAVTSVCWAWCVLMRTFIYGIYCSHNLTTGRTVRGPNLGGGEIFRTSPGRPWCPPSLLYNAYRVFPGGKERPGRDTDPSPSSSAAGHERVELYLYSPYGPYGMYRASVPVQGCTLPLL